MCIRDRLKDEGFVISNFHSGGVVYTMLMIVLRIKVEVIEDVYKRQLHPCRREHRWHDRRGHEDGRRRRQRSCAGLAQQRPVSYTHLTKAAFAPSHENIVFAVKGKYSFPGSRPKDLVTFPKINSSKMVHPTEKPVGLLANLISSVTKPGDLILDPFAGSGSTLVAAKKTGRRFIGIELDDEYFSTAQRRIEEVRE